nr:hypothetical protein [Niabella ginsengisoli]
MFVDVFGLHHGLSGEIIRDGESVFNNTYQSGSPGSGRLNQQEALLTHTERKFLTNDAMDMVQAGDHLKMSGQLNPCKPGCQPAIRRFVNDFDVSAEYHATDTGRSYHWSKSSPGHIIQTEMEGGRVVAKYDYNLNGKKPKRKKLNTH